MAHRANNQRFSNILLVQALAVAVSVLVFVCCFVQSAYAAQLLTTQDTSLSPAQDTLSATTLPGKSVQGITNTNESTKNDAPGTAVAMMRLYQPKTGEHLYTKDMNEKYVLTAKHGWRYEGIGWYAPLKSYTPVYRLYQPKTGEHLYTTDANEKNVLSGKKHGWRYEGIGWYSNDAKEVAVYRLYNKRVRAIASHHYARTASEMNTLVAKHGWKKEGVAWHGVNVTVFGNPTAGRFYERQTAGACESYASAFAINAALNKKATTGAKALAYRNNEFKGKGGAYEIYGGFIAKYFANKIEYKRERQLNASPQLLANLIKDGWIVTHCTIGRYKVFRKPDGTLRFNNSTEGHDICFYAYNEKTRTFYAYDPGVSNGGTILYSWQDIVNYNKVASRYLCFRAR